MDVLYLSPHLDDAALSCGGLIHQQARAGLSVGVLTVFAGSAQTDVRSPFARALETRWGAQGDAIAMRRQEDREALAVLGAEPIHWAYEDAIYRLHTRTGEPVYPNRDAIFGGVSRHDPVKARALASEIRRFWRDAGRPKVYAMLAAGYHVDHQVVQAAVLRLVARDGLDVAWYEDYPYAEDQDAVRQAVAQSPLGALQPQIVRLAEEDLAAKCDAIARYRSQIPIFWQDEADMRRHVRDHALRMGGGFPAEQYWVRASAGDS
ncbi:MAG: PIG-L family deacetylase [Anaerolineales bacterium]